MMQLPPQMARSAGLWLLALVAGLLAVAAAAWHQHLARQVPVLAAELAAQRLAARQPGPPAPAASALPYTASLPQQPVGDEVFKRLLQSGKAHGVVVSSVVAQVVPPTPGTLGRHDMSIGLQGAYAGVKAVLADWLGGQPHLVVQRLSLRRGAAPSTDVDAQVELAFLYLPTLPPGGAQAGGTVAPQSK